MRKYSLACAVAAAAALALPCTAADFSQAPQMVVPYSDLNLSHSEGAKMLIGRLDAAARTVCGFESVDLRVLSAAAAYRKCYHTAMDTAVHHVNNRLVAQLYGNPLLVPEDANVVARADPGAASSGGAQAGQPTSVELLDVSVTGH